MYFKVYSRFSEIINQPIPKTGMAYKKGLVEYNADCWEFANAAHPEISREDWDDPEIVYNFNNYGYRCPQLESPGIKVMSLGCSNTFGLCVPEDKRFSALFCQKLQAEINQPVIDLNLGWPATSIDYIHRMALQTVPVIQPHILLIGTPCFLRSEYVDFQGTLFNFHSVTDSFLEDMQDPSKKHAFMHKQELMNQWDGLRRLHLMLGTVKLLCEKHNVAWLYSVVHKDSRYANYANRLDFTETRVRPLKIHLPARDGAHPSKECHTQHAQDFWNKFQKVYPEVIERLAGSSDE
jgi:hypothetical protein